MIHALTTLVADLFQDAEIFFRSSALPEVGIYAVQVRDHVLFAEILVRVAFVERLRHFGRSTSAVAEREQLPIQLAQAIEGVRLRDFDNEAGFPGKRLLADFQVGAQLGTPKALRHHTRELNTCGSKTHGRLGDSRGSRGQSTVDWRLFQITRTAIPGRRFSRCGPVNTPVRS